MMGRLTNAAAIFALAALAGLFWPASDAAARMAYGRGGEPPRRPGEPSFELVFEGGLAEPMGEQDGTFGEGGGLGAAAGYELGFRLRQYLGGWLAIAPTFHYVDFGSASGVGDFPEGQDLGYRVSTSLLRYGVDLQTFMGRPGDPVRLMLLGGVALAHNRYHDSLQYYQDFETSMNGPSWNAGIGLKMRAIELSAAYVWNGFETANLTAGAETRQYDWNYAVVRLGFAFGPQ
ncbi:MAG: hypothetical protein IH621_16960 [Krumholzibacteria bacterium]|nr:hypothetical protein [Candidatus Krumholzibacteria bacterium]